ncbi:MAG TPA: di-heme oxidoredictase family protein, partial [Steroidobacteraceae bacterium]
AETACQQQPSGGSPEVSDDIFTAVISFQRWLAVPTSPTPHASPDPDANTFVKLGCVACHQPQLRVTLADETGKETPAVIAPYTDLRVHDLGNRLADKTVAGRKVASKWRTAPLWGLGYRMSLERFPTFLHDGRARSAEEAILWHDGEAAGARQHFEQLPAPERKVFLHWLETL